MDVKIFENANCISAIYKDSIPKFQDIEIVKLIILPGEDVELILSIETKELPKEMPSKWIEREVNAIQFVLDFIGVKNIKYNITDGCSCFFQVENLKNNCHKIIVKNKFSNKELSFEARWIYIKNIVALSTE